MTAGVNLLIGTATSGGRYRLVIDLGDFLRADPEARWASWQRARQAGVLSPNDIRAEEDWPASIRRPIRSLNTSAQAIADDKPAGDPPPPSDDSKIIDMGRRHAGD